jgi:hypothetical protein
MERHRQMDAARFAYARRPRMSTTVILLILSVFSVPVRAQTSVSDPKPLDKIQELSAEHRWVEIVRLAEAEAARSAEVNYYYGIALARLERWTEAKSAFQNGLKQKPGDKRFFLELAGVSFKQKDYASAVGYLRSALRLDAADDYANDFLASLYFLQGNLEAALMYWNRVSKPHIEEVRIDPSLKVDPVLLDRAFAFAPASVLLRSQLQTTEARVGGLSIFPSYRIDLEARPDGKFDSVFRARERNGWGNTKWEGLLSLFRGLPFETIHPEFFNIRRRAINSQSLIRWDKEKRRFWTSLSGPFNRDAAWRYGLDLDLRNENWVVRRSFSGPAPPLAGLNLRKQAFTAAAVSFVNGRWNWSSGVELSHREFRDVIPGITLTPQLLGQGFQLKHLGQLNYELVRAPQRRFFVAAGGSTQIGRLWSQPSQAFAKVQGLLQGRWFPQASSDDYEIKVKIRAGKTFGEIPFDELFVLGVERDNDLWLRAHIGTREGRKGSAPLGRNYFLSNWELEKSVFGNALINLKLGPFLDSGKITDPSPGLGSQTWLWDIGVQVKVRVLGIGFACSYGKDLRSGNNAFYVSTF